MKKGLYLATEPSNNLQSIKTYILLKKNKSHGWAKIRLLCKSNKISSDVQIIVYLLLKSFTGLAHLGAVV